MSDIEYKNKYLKYKVKYINLKNEIEQQGGALTVTKQEAKDKFVKSATDLMEVILSLNKFDYEEDIKEKKLAEIVQTQQKEGYDKFNHYNQNPYPADVKKIKLEEAQKVINEQATIRRNAEIDLSTAKFNLANEKSKFKIAKNNYLNAKADYNFIYNSVPIEDYSPTMIIPNIGFVEVESVLKKAKANLNLITGNELEQQGRSIIPTKQEAKS
jgi:hypothetical protein